MFLRMSDMPSSVCSVEETVHPLHVYSVTVEGSRVTFFGCSLSPPALSLHEGRAGSPFGCALGLGLELGKVVEPARSHRRAEMFCDF